MPIYEYLCRDCRKRVSVFFRSYAAVGDPACPECGGTKLERRFSRVVVRRGGAAQAEGAGDDDFDGDFGGFPGGDEFGGGLGDDFGLDEDADPRDLARWARHMSAQMGEPLDPELDSALADMERGADPDEVMSRLEESDPEPES
ncbi:MAG TPA: zinc ribbon domain-containing protein [Thermomicrobiaceae bacterium]|nr:zinc ribbon domain-containing protein [Thermomicrobiaceae bacterium]